MGESRKDAAMKTKVLIISIVAIIVFTCSGTFGEMLVPDGSKCATPPPLLKHPKEMGIPCNANSLKTKVVGRLSILLDGMNTSEFARENMGKRRISYFNPLATATITAEGGERRTYYVPSSIPASYFPDTIEEYQYGEGKVVREAEPNQVDTLSRRDMAVARFFSDSTIVVYAVVRNGKWITSYINIGTPGVIRDMMEPYVPVEVAITILGGNDTKVDYPTQDREQVVSIHQPSKSTSTNPASTKDVNIDTHSTINPSLKSQETIQEDSPQALMSRFGKARVEGDRQLYSDCFADEFFGKYIGENGKIIEYKRTEVVDGFYRYDPEIEILKTKQLGPKAAIIYFYQSAVGSDGSGKLRDTKIIDYLTNQSHNKTIHGEHVNDRKLSPKMYHHFLFVFKAMELNGKWQFVELLYSPYSGELSKLDNEQPLITTSSVEKSQASEQITETDKAKRFNELMSYARARKNREQAREAMRALEEALVLHPDNGEALSLRKELENYYGSSPGNIIANSIGMKLVYIPPGGFLMGSPLDEEGHHSDEGPQHRVKITNGFYMDIYEVTQAQYQAVMGNNPSNFRGDNLPVEMVSWNEAIEFCNRLNQKEGRRYRLPTEAEWEYACRAGTVTPFSIGESISTEQANYDGDYFYGSGQKGIDRQRPVEVGSFRANAFGLYEVHGNVSEWCNDWYATDYYASSPDVDPHGPLTGQFHVIRGGSWGNSAAGCRSALREGIEPAGRMLSLGFRVVLEFQGTPESSYANSVNGMSKQERSRESSADSIVVTITNSDGSITSVALRCAGEIYIGPRGEQYMSLPTSEQLQPVYDGTQVETDLVGVNVYNDNGSITPITLRRSGNVWIGPRGEQYMSIPTAEQLKPLYSSTIQGEIDAAVVNIKNSKGFIVPVILQRSPKSYIGPMGELYMHLPTSEQLKTLYGVSIQGEPHIVVININNNNGSITLVTLRQTGGMYVGPRGEQYVSIPTPEQLKPLYGF